MLFYLFRDHGFVDITTFVAAMIISLETITTVGYSVSDINFGLFFSLASLSGDHTLAFFLLYGEMMQAILMNSFCIGIVYKENQVPGQAVISIPTGPKPGRGWDTPEKGGHPLAPFFRIGMARIRF